MPNLNDGLGAADAATCGAGYYLENSVCTECKPRVEAYYCPGDGQRYACPKTDTDYAALTGWTVTTNGEAAWATNGTNSTSPSDCRSSFYFRDEDGSEILSEFAFNGVNYWGPGMDNVYYYAAGAGQYLSPFKAQSWRVWYYGTKPCTNAPANAHYTGPGTPDAPDGSVTDANDCPWACDTGFGRVGDECKPLCGAGVTQLRAGDTIVSLFLTRHTTPALLVGINGVVCYGNLAVGNGDGINIQYGGTVYHTD